ncbi:hypothetical protein BXY75_3427 [Ulvibacter antarcticus]|uniref:Uncharacterized protein n=2 Tax=Ulvibacter antarcticus TaxID=442714 RepID=A0A3L9YDT7_9FLAO|nr:hypothetical protein BXY75_3427 [Ulvibacter antarcticus]
MLTENKFSKYLLYAIGEILLVMIGILLAFQVNKWNEIKKDNILQKNLLKEIKIGLISDLKDVTSNIERQQEILTNQQLIINWIQSDKEYQDTIAKSLADSYQGTYFGANDGPYETLKQIGLRRIQNDSLRNQISNLYNIVYPLYRKFDDIYAENQMGMFGKSSEHLSEITWSQLITINDIDRFKSDNKYLFAMKTTKNIGKILINLGMIPTKNSIEFTLELIEQELEE